MRNYDSPGVITPHPISHGVDVTCSHKSGNYLALPFSTSLKAEFTSVGARSTYCVCAEGRFN